MKVAVTWGRGPGGGCGLLQSPIREPFLTLRFGKGEKVTGQERKNKLECSTGWRATFQHQNSLRACPLPPPTPSPDLRPTHLNLQGVGQGQQLDSLYLEIRSRKGTFLLLPSRQSQGDSDSILTKVPKLLVFGALEAPEQCLSAPTQQRGADACNPLPPGPSYPQRVSLEGTHHGQKQGLLQESEECTDQRLQSCEAAELGGGVPAGQ